MLCILKKYKLFWLLLLSGLENLCYTNEMRKTDFFERRITTMAKIYKSVEELIGNTPLLELTKIEKGTGATLLAKVEALNPGGSAKDRIAKRMVEDAEKAGILKEGATIIEPTSGNTGIGLALMAAARGYRAIIVMPDSMSMERRLLMTAFGAELVLTEGKQGMKGAVEKAEELAKEIPDSFIAGQFDNPRPTLRRIMKPQAPKSGQIPMARWIFSLQASAQAAQSQA